MQLPKDEAGEVILFNRHLDPAWKAVPVGMSENGEVVWKDGNGEFFGLVGRKGTYFREERAKPESGDGTRLKAVAAAAEELQEAAEKHKVPVSAITVLLGGDPPDTVGENAKEM